MKKMLSMILCVALVLTLGVVAFAADGVAELGNNTYNYVADSGDIYLEFTAEEAGNYTITNNTTADGAYLAVPSYCVTEGQAHCYGNGQQIFITLEADETIEINLWSNKGADIAYDFDIVLTGAAGGDEPEKETNDVPQIGENYMFIPAENASGLEVSFTPENTATYVFTITGEGYFMFADGWTYGPKQIQLTADEEFTFEICSAEDGDSYCEFTIEEQVIEGELNEEPQLGTNNILAGDSYYKDLTFVAAEGGLYKITNTHEEGDETYFYSYYFSQSYVYAGKSAFFELDEGEDIEFTAYPKDTTIKFTIDKVDPATVEPDGSSMFPFVAVAGEAIDIEMEASEYVYYTFTAPADGVLTLTGEVTDANIYVDGLIRTAEDTWVMNVTEGEVVEIELVGKYSWSGEVNPYVCLDVEFEEGELEPNGTEKYPYELPIGTLTASAESSSNKVVYYTYTATEDGLLMLVSGLEESLLNNIYFTGLEEHADLGTYYLNMAEGDTVVLRLSSYTVFEMNATVSFLADEEYHNGSYSDPFILEEGETEIVLTESNSGEGYYYTFTATEAGVYTIVLPEKIEVYAHPFTMSEDGRTGTVELEAGETIEFNLWADKIAVDGVFTFGIDDGNDGPVVDPDPIVPAGDYTFLVFAMMVVSMAAIVVLVSKKRNF